MKWIRITGRPDFIKARIKLPASKSISNRALIIRALSGGHFNIHNLSEADDTQLLASILDINEKEFYVKNAGTVMRFLTAYFAASDKEVILRGSERMNQRPIAPLVDTLRAMGASIQYLEKEGYPPLEIKGRKLKGGKVNIQGDISSQFISALLLIAPTLQEGLTVEIQGEVVSEPYILLTLEMLSYFGISYQRSGNTISIPPQEYVTRDYMVAADWSAASYWFSLAALFPHSDVQFPYLYFSSAQGDSILKEIISDFGVECEFSETTCRLMSLQMEKVPFNFDFTPYPDLVPALTVLATTLCLDFNFTGLGTLKHKESDRARVLQHELAKIGAALDLDDNSLRSRSYGPVPDKDIFLNTYDDHRMAMSFAIAASLSPHIWIENPDVTEKSYPNFWTDLNKAGFTTEIIDI